MADNDHNHWIVNKPIFESLLPSVVVYSGCMPSYLTARQAAKLLGSAPRTASRRAKEAAERGDPMVIRLGRAWGAPESWWREHLKPKPMGHPRQSADNP
jgi:hypothetical protein